jgi:FkbM family methyltransferase
MERRLYLDLGANHGHTIRSYLNENPGTLVFGFEPNPTLASELKRQFAGPSSGVCVLAAAAWIWDGEVDLYPGIRTDESSTLLVGKVSEWPVDYDAPMRVPSIDFDRWLLLNTNASDDIYLKMDIEGAEYEVLQRCMETGSIGRIRAARIEWHYDRYPNISKAEHERIRSTLQGILPVEDWI